MKTPKIKVNLLDDHKVVTDGLTSVLYSKPDIEILDIAHSGEQLLSQLVSRQPDIILTDYSLSSHSTPNVLNGLETAVRVMVKYPKIKILMMSMYEDMEIVISCIESGVHGYIWKGEKDFDIYKAVKKVFEEGDYLSPEIASQIARNLRVYKEAKITLSTQERVILDLLLEGHSDKEIGNLIHISKRTVDNIRNKMLKKFEARNTVEMIRKALKQGILKIDNP